MNRLYNTVSDPLRREKVNPIPENEDPQQLPENFADFFLTKIKKIRSELSAFPLYEPTDTCTNDFREFRPIDEETMCKILGSAKRTTSALDPCPSTWIKNSASIFIPLVTKIANLSLCKSVFDQSWNRAVVMIQQPHFSDLRKAIDFQKGEIHLEV